MLIDPEVDRRWGADRMLGTTVAGRYGVVDVLGEGGMGLVYEAVQEPVGRHVALKLMLPETTGAKDAQARFMREARVAAALSDPCVATLYDFGAHSNGALYMAVERVSGQELLEVLQAEGRIAPERAVEWVLQVLGGLAEAHDAGLIHRDLKPENLMLSVDSLGRERVRMLDFGIARPVNPDEYDDVTRAGLVLGTPRYMSPEQATGQALDARSDLFSLGVVLYLALCGRLPIDSESELEVLRKVVEDPPAPLPADVANPALRAAVMRSMAKRPSQRFQSAREMAEALRLAIEIEPPETAEMKEVRVAPSLPAGSTGPDPRLLKGAIGVGALACLLLAVFIALQLRTPASPPADDAPVTISLGVPAPLVVVRDKLAAGDREGAVKALAAALKEAPAPGALAATARGMSDLAPLLEEPSVRALLP